MRLGMKGFFLLGIFLYGTLLYPQLPVVHVDSLQQVAKKGNPKAQFIALCALSEEYSKTDLDQSLIYGKRALSKAKAIKDDALVPVALNIIANTFQYKSQLDSSLVYHEQALKLRRKLKDSLGMADSYNNIGIVYDTKGQFHEALDSYFKALYYYDKKGDLAKMAMTFTNIGIIYKFQKEYLKALEYYQKANVLYRKINDDFGITVSSGNLGSVLINFKRYEESLQYSEIAKKGYKKLGYDRYIAFPVSNIAVVYDSLHRFIEANSNYLESIKGHENYQNWYEVANICNAYANCLNKQKKHRESILISQKAIEAAKKSDAYFLEVSAFENLAKANSGLGNFSEAYKYSQLFNHGKDSLFVSEKTKAIFELETKYQTEKKEKLLLKKEAEARQRNIWLIILLILALSAILIGYLIYRQQKLKNKQQEQEFQLKSAIAQIETQNKLQDQRLSISRDLHDNIGAQLTFIISSVDNIKYAFDLENTKLDTKLESISNFTKSTIVELRDTIWAMNSNEISFEDLRLRIFNLIEKAKMAKEDIDFKFHIDENSTKQKFSSIKGMNIYRTIQEAVNNSIKYANAQTISVRVKSDDDKIKIVISDDGIGFDAETTSPGNGLRNMKKRLNDIGGQFSVESQPGKGTTVTILVNNQTNPTKND